MHVANARVALTAVMAQQNRVKLVIQLLLTLGTPHLLNASVGVGDTKTTGER